MIVILKLSVELHFWLAEGTEMLFVVLNRAMTTCVYTTCEEKCLQYNIYYAPTEDNLDELKAEFYEQGVQPGTCQI